MCYPSLYFLILIFVFSTLSYANNKFQLTQFTESKVISHFSLFTPVIFNQLTLSQNCAQHPVSAFSVEIKILAISCLHSGKHLFFPCIC